jgi:hypothetical protein
MERAALLTPTDIHVIRRYVQTKYAPLPRHRQAEIVADAVRVALERRLPDLSPVVKTRIVNELIRRCVVQEQREVAIEDVLEACAAEGAHDGIDLEPLRRWIDERSPDRSSRERMEARLRREPGANSEETAADMPGTAGTAASSVLGLPTAEGISSPAAAAVGTEPAAALANPLAGTERLPAWSRRAAWIALALSLSAGAAIGWLSQREATGEASPVPERPYVRAAPGTAEAQAGMPEELRYADIDAAAVKAYLRSRNSLLADEPYFGAIVASARKYDVNPLLLLAITGQEQGFVPKTGKQAKLIANNPFNVFHSWQEYNTDIADASDIAAKLVAKLGASRPAGRDPFEWLNRTYAEDPEWAEGVRQLFDKLTHLPASQP